ncbi:MAG: TonB-dependent receptor, partial [Muribaculaceae bacterium]|nr:TonB-dependent receptor [Muribaculaceae bacterium]
LVGNRNRDVKSGWVNALWINYEGLVKGNVFFSGGIRLNTFSAMPGRWFHKFQTTMAEETPDYSSKIYFIPEPRISVKWDINSNQNIKAGIAHTSQSLHSIRSSATSFPFDRFALSSSTIKPEQTWQIVGGYTGKTSDGNYDWSVETYYKKMNNVYDFRDGYSMFSKLNLEKIILGGKGRSCGLELMFRKNTGHLTGWIAYSLSKTQTKINGINNGKWYDATNDRRHDISIVGIYKFNDKWSLSGSWIFSSGTPLTVPDDKYELSGTTIYYYSKRNGYRTPPTHRLDLSSTYLHTGKRFTYEWSFGIYNIYCRYNPYIVYFVDDANNPSGTKAVLRAMFGIIPSVSYTLKF